MKNSVETNTLHDSSYPNKNGSSASTTSPGVESGGRKSSSPVTPYAESTKKPVLKILRRGDRIHASEPNKESVRNSNAPFAQQNVEQTAGKSSKGLLRVNDCGTSIKPNAQRNAVSQQMSFVLSPRSEHTSAQEAFESPAQKSPALSHRSSASAGQMESGSSASSGQVRKSLAQREAEYHEARSRIFGHRSSEYEAYGEPIGPGTGEVTYVPDNVFLAHNYLQGVEVPFTFSEDHHHHLNSIPPHHAAAYFHLDPFQEEQQIIFTQGNPYFHDPPLYPQSAQFDPSHQTTHELVGHPDMWEYYWAAPTHCLREDNAEARPPITPS